MQLKPIILILFSAFIVGCSVSKKVNQSSSKKSKATQLVDLPEKDQIQFKFLFHNGTKEKILGNFQLAGNLFNQCIQIGPMEPAPYFELATIYDLSSEKSTVVKYAAKAVELDPENYWYRIMYAQSLQKAGDSHNAIKQYEELIKRNPDNIDLYFDLAGLQLYSGQYEKSIESFNDIERKVGITEETSIQKQKIYIKLGDVEKAAGELKKLIDAFPENSVYKGLLADLYIANNMSDKAYEIYQEILKDDPTNAYIHLSLYEYYKLKGDDKKAFEEVKHAFQNDDLNIDTKMQILLSYYSITESNSELKKEAFELNKILIETHPKDAKSYTIYADFLYREGKLESARENYLKAIEYDNSKFAIWSQVLFIDSELQNYDYVIEDSKTALELFPNQPLFYFFYGTANLQKKNYNEAKDYLVTGKDFVIDNPSLLAQFYSSLGDAYNGMKEYEKSDESYEKTLKIEPQNIYVLNNYSYYLALRGEKLEKAEQLSALCNELEPDEPNYEDTYAWILYKQGKFIQAKEWLERALKNGGTNNVTILEHLGDVFAQLKNMEKALKYWKEAKEKGDGTELLDKKIADKKLYE